MRSSTWQRQFLVLLVLSGWKKNPHQRFYTLPGLNAYSERVSWLARSLARSDGPGETARVRGGLGWGYPGGRPPPQPSHRADGGRVEQRESLDESTNAFVPCPVMAPGCAARHARHPPGLRRRRAAHRRTAAPPAHLLRGPPEARVPARARGRARRHPPGHCPGGSGRAALPGAAARRGHRRGRAGGAPGDGVGPRHAGARARRRWARCGWERRSGR